MPISPRTRLIEVEQWMDVVGAEAILRVSSFGRIMRIGRSNCKSTKPPKIWTPPSPKNRVWVAGRGSIHIANLVLEAFVGPCPEGMECCHWDDNQSNNRLDNLRWDTHANNVRDGYRNGAPRKRKHWKKKLSI